jgi:hypothetical protein
MIIKDLGQSGKQIRRISGRNWKRAMGSPTKSMAA